MSIQDDDAALSVRLERIKMLTDELVRTQADSTEAQHLAERIKREVDATREAVKIYRR